MRPTPFRGPPIPFTPQRFLSRARLFRSVAIPLADMHVPEPNWPKYFLVTHSIELAIRAFLAFEKGLKRPRPPVKEPDDHDLMALYELAVVRGLKRNDLVMKDLPHLSELHKSHYARYPAYEAKPVALISQFDDMVDQLFSDVSAAIGP
jgi:hypothetical protein